MSTSNENRKVDSERVLALAASYKDRTKTSVYISARLYERFQRVCEDRDANASRAIEVLIYDFLDDLGELPAVGGKKKRSQ